MGQRGAFHRMRFQSGSMSSPYVPVLANLQDLEDASCASDVAVTSGGEGGVHVRCAQALIVLA